MSDRKVRETADDPELAELRLHLGHPHVKARDMNTWSKDGVPVPYLYISQAGLWISVRLTADEAERLGTELIEAASGSRVKA